MDFKKSVSSLWHASRAITSNAVDYIDVILTETFAVARHFQTAPDEERPAAVLAQLADALPAACMFVDEDISLVASCVALAHVLMHSPRARHAKGLASALGTVLGKAGHLATVNRALVTAVCSCVVAAPPDHLDDLMASGGAYSLVLAMLRCEETGFLGEIECWALGVLSSCPDGAQDMLDAGIVHLIRRENIDTLWPEVLEGLPFDFGIVCASLRAAHTSETVESIIRCVGENATGLPDDVFSSKVAPYVEHVAHLSWWHPHDTARDVFFCIIVRLMTADPALLKSPTVAAHVSMRKESAFFSKEDIETVKEACGSVVASPVGEPELERPNADFPPTSDDYLVRAAIVSLMALRRPLRTHPCVVEGFETLVAGEAEFARGPVARALLAVLVNGPPLAQINASCVLQTAIVLSNVKAPKASFALIKANMMVQKDPIHGATKDVVTGAAAKLIAYVGDSIRPPADLYAHPETPRPAEVAKELVPERLQKETAAVLEIVHEKQAPTKKNERPKIEQKKTTKSPPTKRDPLRGPAIPPKDARRSCVTPPTGPKDAPRPCVTPPTAPKADKVGSQPPAQERVNRLNKCASVKKDVPLPRARSTWAQRSQERVTREHIAPPATMPRRHPILDLLPESLYPTPPSSPRG